MEQNGSKTVMVGVLAFVFGGLFGFLAAGFLNNKVVPKQEFATIETPQATPCPICPQAEPVNMEPAPAAGKEHARSADQADFEITEEMKQHLMSIDVLKLLQDAEISRYKFGGETRGIRLRKIRTASLFQRAGFKDDDIIEQVNGLAVGDIQGMKSDPRQVFLSGPMEFKVRRGSKLITLRVKVAKTN